MLASVIAPHNLTIKTEITPGESENDETMPQTLEEWADFLTNTWWKLAIWILAFLILFCFFCFITKCCYLIWDCCTDSYWGCCPRQRKFKHFTNILFDKSYGKVYDVKLYYTKLLSSLSLINRDVKKARLWGQDLKRLIETFAQNPIRPGKTF